MAEGSSPLPLGFGVKIAADELYLAWLCGRQYRSGMETTRQGSKILAAKQRPQAVMRARRPHLFSDTVRSTRPVLAREVFEYHLDTLTSRKQEYEFEHFCRRLAEKEICPNLRAQTGPTGGGDSKVDTETYPVAAEVSDRWWIGEPSAGAERWAFAFSAKKTWKPKVEKDVQGILSTGRKYDRIYFFSNQFISDKKRAAAEDALSALGTPVHIVDRAWLVDKVFNNDHVALALATLQMQGGGEAAEKPGPNDTERTAELEALDRQIADPTAYANAEFQLVEDCLHAALLARGLERTRAEIDGRFLQAARLAKKVDYRQQLMRVAYNRAWTAYWWFEDYDAFVVAYDEVEQHLGDSTRASDLERLVNLWQLLATAVFQSYISPEQAKLIERTQRLEQALEAAVKDGGRPNNALQARSDLWLMRMTQAFQRGDTDALDAGWRDLRAIITDAARHGAFPIERLAEIVREIGQLVDNDAYDHAYEEVVDAVRRLRSDAEAGQAYNERGVQKLKQNKPYEAIKWFGRAEGLLQQTPEQRGPLNIALIGSSSAYEASGLLWAARNKALVALERSLAPFNEDGEMARAALPCAQRLVWLELQLGRIPSILASMVLAHFIDTHLKLSDERRAALSEERQTQEGVLGIHLLNLRAEDFQAAAKLPDILERLGLTNAKLALLWALGRIDTILAEGYFEPGTDPLERTRFFEMWQDQPAGEQIRGTPLLMDGARAQLRSVVLGATFIADCPNDPVGVALAESVLGALEAFMATSDEDDVFPHREVTTITFHDGLKAGQKPLTQYERETGTFRIDYPSEIEFGSGKEMIRHIHWLRDTMGTLAAGAFVIRDVEAWMTRLGADENAFGRSVALGDMLTLSRNVFGYDPSFSLAAWSAPDDQTYPPERTTPWRVKERAPEPSAEKVMKFAEGVSPEDMFDKTTLRHDQRGVLSPIETPLWDAAKWRGTMFGQYPDMPPILALGYTNPQYGEQIFDGWKARWGEVDKNDDLRVAIITGVCRRNPSHYSIIIGPNPLRQTNGRKLVTMLSRHQRMEPASLDNLNGFLERYYAYNAYFLTTAHMSANPDFDPKLFIQKSNLVVRPAWQIGPNDPDISVLRDGDDPIIPPDVADPPIRRAMAWDRELKSKRPRR